MAQAITSDFATVPGVHVVTTRDTRVPAFHDTACEVHSIQGTEGGDHEFTQLRGLANSADWSLIIAPEMHGHLQRLCQVVSESDGRLLSPGYELVKLATSKQATAEHLAAHSVPCPQGRLVDGLSTIEQSCFPVVLKPNDGCGSLGVQKVGSQQELEAAFIRKQYADPPRLERFVPGTATSVSVLCGQGKAIALPACQQLLSQDGQFTYHGGWLPLPLSLDDRARRLATAAVRTLPKPLGYIGVDLVLGDDANGRDDCVIEINPRLTTSYVGLRELSETNLAAAMLAVACGEQPALSWRGGAVEFSFDGHVTMNGRTTHLGSHS